MSPAPALRRLGGSAESHRADPRLHPRYPITLDLKYKLLKGRRVEHLGCGRTLNISSGGVLFEANDTLEGKDISNTNGLVELVMDWPLLLQKVCALKLVVRGRIVRHDTRRLALRIEQHEFRTAGLNTAGSVAKPPDGAR
jgi:hypothetical protein